MDSPQHRPLAGIATRLAAVFFLSVMYASSKVAEAHGASLWELLFARQAFALPLVAGIVAAGPGFASLRTARMPSHIARSAMGMTGMLLNFATVAMLPLAEATTLSFTVPLFGTMLSALILKEPTGWHRWGAVVVGFVGVLIVTQPGSGHLPVLGTIIGLLAAVGVACISLMLRDLGRTEAALTTVFWFTTLSLVPLAVLMVFVARTHDAMTWGWMILVGVSGGCAQLAVTASLKLARVATVLPMDYSGLLWATLLGWLLFGALPTAWTWAGAPVIVASGLYIVWREHRLARIVNREAVALD